MNRSTALVLRHDFTETLTVVDAEHADAQDAILSTVALDDLADTPLRDLLINGGIDRVLAAMKQPGYEVAMQRLASSDAAFRQRRSLVLEHRLVTCSCGSTGPIKTMIALPIPGVHGWLCVPCADRARSAERRRLAKRGIRAALARSRAAGLPATLTQEEWEETLRFFAQRCAYCKREWYVVEHVVPTESGGGTTNDNCVPACYGCNSTKGRKTISDPSLNLNTALVRAFLRRIRRQRRTAESDRRAIRGEKL